MESRHILLLQTSTVADRYRGVREYAHTHGWHLHVVTYNGKPPRSWRGDGILVCVEESPAIIRFLQAQLRHDIPVVELAEHLTRIKLPRISIDNRKLGEIAAAYFLRHQFAHAAWFSSGWSHVHKSRERSFRRALGADVGYERWCWGREAGAGDCFDAFAFVQWLGRHLRKTPKPLCIFCYNDADAVHVIETCADYRIKVPEDVAVLGIDDEHLICNTSAVPISSIRHNFHRIGYEGAALLDGVISRRVRTDKTIYVMPDGIAERRSTDTLGVENVILRRALAFIDMNFGKPIGAEEIGHFLGLPRNAVYRLFSSELKRSVCDEILRRRLKMSKNLLGSETASVNDIAKACGFCNASYFIRKFHAAFGLTPKEFSQQGKDSGE